MRLMRFIVVFWVSFLMVLWLVALGFVLHSCSSHELARRHHGRQGWTDWRPPLSARIVASA